MNGLVFCRWLLAQSPFVPARGSATAPDSQARHRGVATADTAAPPWRIRAGESVLLREGKSGKLPKRVLVAIDFSPASEQAALLAIRRFPAAQLVFMHVWPSNPEAQEGAADLADALAVKQRALRSLADRWAPAQLHSVVVQRGDAAQTLAAYAVRMRADLIALGSIPGLLMPRLLRNGLVNTLHAQTECGLLLCTPAAETQGSIDRMQ